MYEFALIIYAIALVASGFLCRDAYQHRFLPAARPLMIMSIILTLTCFIRFTQLVQPDLNQWILQAFEDIEFALIQPMTTPLLAWLLLEYHLDKKIKLTHKILALFYIQPTITITLTLTDIFTNGFLSQSSPAALINSQDRLGDYLLVRKIYTAVVITGII
ncbi:MAG: histidine kinase N-terminal 7TM domain-containing protein, partial [Endozoicomonas sp.]